MTQASPTLENPLLSRLGELSPDAIGAVLSDLGVDPATVATPRDEPEPSSAAGRSLLLPLSAGTRPLPERAGALRELCEAHLSERGWLLLWLTGRRDELELAAWRNQLWPLLHVGAVYRLLSKGAAERWTVGGARAFDLGEVKAGKVHVGSLVCAQRRLAAMAPDATVAKFDANASGWNGAPGSPGYPHFRWMRRYVARFARPRGRPERVLDFGCGAGWVGIEAAKRFRARSLSAFDPSPEMVRIAGENARAEGVADFHGATGFGEDPPFPRAGDPPFDLVLSSGVVSFSPDFDRWFEGLDRAVAPGGHLVIGDLSPESLGMRRRRRTRPLLPARELNAMTRDEARARLEARGFVHRATAGYQLTTPVPEMAHVSETRLKGLLSPPLLWVNRLATGVPGKALFDSWVMRFDRD